jgi:tubulin alpha
VIEAIEHTFDLLYARRAFIHWFVGEGLESGEFNECRENLAALRKDFEGINVEDLVNNDE